MIFSAEDYYGKFHNPDCLMDRRDGYEAYRRWPDRDSSGFFYMLKFRPGLILTIIDHRAPHPLSIEFKESSDCYILSFILTGTVDIRTGGRGLPRNRHTMVLDPARSYLSNTRGGRGMAMYPEGGYCSVAISIAPDLLKTFWNSGDERFAEDICHRLSLPSPHSSFHRPLEVTPVIRMRFHEILGCSYQGGPRRFYLESKILELMVLGLSQFAPDTPSTHPCFDRISDEYESASRARDIMIENMKNPPNLSELSRLVGVNKKKLNLSFRKIYGTSVFDYLRTCRLETSKNLLRYSHKNVTEVAFEVGYAQQSNFTKEFKKYFGTSPRTYME